MKPYTLGFTLVLCAVQAVAQDSLTAQYYGAGRTIQLPPEISGECVDLIAKGHRVRIQVTDIQSLAKVDSDLRQSQTGLPFNHPVVPATKLLQDIEGRPKRETGCWSVSGSRENLRVYAYLVAAGRASIQQIENSIGVSTILVRIKDAPHRGGGILFSTTDALLFVSD